MEGPNNKIRTKKNKDRFTFDNLLNLLNILNIHCFFVVYCIRIIFLI